MIRVFAAVLFFFAFVSESTALPVTFNVRMGHLMTLGRFDKNKDYVDVAGTFNGWNGTSHRLADADGDSTFTITIENTAFVTGAQIQFKFRINGSWAGTEEFPNAGPNRVYTVKASDNVITVWYNDEEPAVGPPRAELSVSSTAIFNDGYVYFKDLSKGIVTGRRWYFEGGIPSVSTDSLPAIQYPNPGVFDVTLVSYNETEKDSIIMENFITVSERAVGSVKWWNDAVFYEIFVRSFYDSNGDGIGDLRGIIQKLDYLNDGNPQTTTDLGITGIWLMPINPSPSYHGYDVTDYRGIHPQYGTMDDFKELLDKAHQRGIRIIVDYVMNHSSEQHPWFVQSASSKNSPLRSYFRWSDTNPGGGWHSRNGAFYYGYFWSGMPDLNYDTPAVKDSMFAITDYWLKDVRVDGFRLDAAIHIFEDGAVNANVPKTFTFWGEFNQRVKAANPDAFSVGEAWTSFDFMRQYVQNDRLDYVFEFDVASAILNSVNGENSAPIRQAIQKSYDTFPYLQFGTFLTNHDQNRVAEVLGQSVPKMKAAASIYLTFPGIPYLYYGEEVAMRGAKPDEDIRKPMQWTAGAGAGFTGGTPWRAPNSNYASFNVAGMQADTTSLWHHYRKLIQLRNRLEPLRRGTFSLLFAGDDAVLAFRREVEGQHPVIVLINTSGTSKTGVSINPGDVNFCENSTAGQCGQQWTDLFNYTSFDLSDEPDAWRFNIPAYGVRVLQLSSFTLNADLETSLPKTAKLLGNYPNPFNPATTLQYVLPSALEIRLAVSDVNGRSIKVLHEGRQQAGTHTINVDLSGFSSGVYFVTLTAPAGISVRKITLLK